MDNRKAELKKIKKHEIHSNWYLILALCAISAAWVLIIYLVAIFQNIYSSDSIFKITNDLVVSIISGLISGIIVILLAFIFLDLIKRSYIKDYFTYYCYLNSLKNKSKYTFFKDSKIPMEFYKKDATKLTKSAFISLVAKILDYSLSSPQYKNLVNEIDTDFAIHSFLEPNYENQRKHAIIRIVILDILIPLVIDLILIGIAIGISFSKSDKDTLSAIIRIIIVFISTIFSLGLSITIYEFYILNSVKNYSSFNDFYLLSFNNFEFKYLNSSLVKR
ncbi:hypothetical protein DMC14_001330 [Metamycoplasma phocicerebrale]|uniref:Uncharacterized protein n=1 Tax=Metamycoplasma phocicerebrale TaxID=142649 RepID=A0A3T0TUL2_9BACT|nr:hypothetical protein [Metamycoplasma phocicerebrale]AZZ65795.1 hypothetical protein DMC14_001330 [Metamycoplasma phocicerebrale]